MELVFNEVFQSQKTTRLPITKSVDIINQVLVYDLGLRAIADDHGSGFHFEARQIAQRRYDIGDLAARMSLLRS